MSALHQILVDHAPQALRERLAALVDLEQRLETLLEQAHGGFPELMVDDATFVRFVAERLPSEHAPEQALELMRADELLLACACSQRDEAAIALFHDRFAPGIRAALHRVGAVDMIEDVIQVVLTKLFVGERPAIAKYGGRGKLAAWVEVVAVREARDRQRKRQASQHGRAQRRDEMELLVERAIEATNPELQRLKGLYREQFKAAFARAFAKLPVRQCNLLRHEYLDGLSSEHIGALYGVHRGTVARWRADARTALFKETRRIFEQELNVPPREFDSVLRLIQSQLHVSLARLLRRPDE